MEILVSRLPDRRLRQMLRRRLGSATVWVCVGSGRSGFGGGEHMVEDAEAAGGEREANRIDMLDGPLLSKIIVFAVPLALSGMLQMLFNAVDSSFAGQFVGSTALAAVGMDSQVIGLLVNLVLGVSTGATVVIAQCMGSGQRQGIKAAVHTTYLFAVVGGIVLGVIGIVLAMPILNLLSTPDNVIDEAALYLRIYCLGMPFNMVYNFVSAIERSVGDTRRPLYALLASGILNIFLNWLAVGVLGMGIGGIAAATSVSNVLAAALVTGFLMGEKGDLKLSLRQLGFDSAALGKILRIGIPTGLQGVLFTFSNVCIQSGINVCGSDAIAGSSAATFFEQLNFSIVSGFVQAGITFTSQNYAAGKLDRCQRAARLTAACALVAVFIEISLFLGFRGPLISLFTSEEGATAYADYRMTHVLVFAWMIVTYEVPGGLMRGYGYSLTPSVIAVFGTCVLRLVWLFVAFPANQTFEFLLLCYPISWIATGTATVIAYLVVKHRAWKAAGHGGNGSAGEEPAAQAA